MGPLSGFKIVEIAGIGPGQLAGMLLADMGAEIIRIERLTSGDPGVAMPARFNLMNRSRPSVALDLKHEDGVKLVLDLCETADAIFEGYRPGVMERFGLGPRECMERNSKLVYGRMTGWGQQGPLANSVGHDTNYIALTGALDAIGEADGLPVMPLNLVGDFGGGALYLVVGMLAAMLEAGRSGCGQVVDAAMVDGTASLMTLFHGLQAGGMWQERRGSNLLDGAAPFAGTYATSDDKAIAVCAIENRFFRALLDGIGTTEIDPADQYDTGKWPQQRAILEKIFATRTRDEWSDILEDTDGCFAPVLSISEAPDHPHNEARKTYVDVDGIRQPAPAPRFSRTVSEIRCPPEEAGQNALAALTDWGIGESDVRALMRSGVVGGGAKPSKEIKNSG